jgi:twinkle protein
MTISPRHAAFLEGRGISTETASRMGVLSVRWRTTGDQGEAVPDPAGDVLAFPFLEGGKEVACKFRAAGKRFWQRAGGRKTFYNSDVLDDPEVTSGRYPLVIVEGELDALATVEAGYPFVVSVPDGAPPARDKDGNLLPVEGDIEFRPDDKYGFVFNNWDRLARIPRIIVAVDNDEPGTRLTEELVRRLGRVRCSFIVHPEGCKDLNDVLMRHGRETVLEVLKVAKPFPVNGLYRADEVPPEPPIRPMTTGWGRLDDLIKPYFPSLMVVSGFANRGKSTWTMQLVSQLAKLHGWRCAIASFEMRLRPYVFNALKAPYLGKPAGQWTPRENEAAEDWLRANFFFISPDDEDNDPHDLEWILERAEAAVIRHGIRVLLIDPWNEIEHTRRNGETLTEYTGRALRRLKVFAKRFGVLVILVAHPSKSALNKGRDQDQELSLYDVSDSAHFANKPDFGVIIDRPDKKGNITKVSVVKVRYQPDAGRLDDCDLVFDPATRLYSQ